ncbi:Gfo/Idh/MocA family protein [Natronospora cellulosivora (SeqCode)]
MDKVKIGIIGIGNMGTSHARNLLAAKVAGGELHAVCDTDPDRLEWAKKELGEDVKRYENHDDFFADDELDAVIIATPHYDHPPLAIKAFENDLHVLVEKPAGVYTKQVREMNEASEKSDKVFCIMYNQRTNPLFQKLKDLIESGELGEIKRTNWIITNWYRSQSYFDSGGWRASWEGEGGGTLLNQNPHNLDLWQWTCGMPVRVRAFCHFGKYHDIEVEDDVTAYVEYENGATGVYITSTADAPGTNRLEVTGDRGKIVIEDNKLSFWRLRTPEREFNKNYKGGFGQPECWKCDVPVHGKETAHLGIMNDWLDSILNGTELLAPGVEGIKGLMISNAMYLSSWNDDWIYMPIDEDLFYEKLQEKIKNSNFEKKDVGNKALDVSGTH